MGRFIMGFLAFAVVIVVAAWFTLKRDDIPYETLNQRYAFKASHFIDLPEGERAHYVDVGPRNSTRTVVLLHGYASSSHTWVEWMRTLQGSFRVIAIDLPAHGLTQTPQGYVYSASHFEDFTEALLSDLGVTDFVLVGAGMGGAVAWNYALEHPEKLEGLALVGAFGWERTEEESTSHPMYSSLIYNEWARSILQKIDMSDTVQALLDKSFSEPDLITSAMVQRYTEFSYAPEHRKGLFDLIAGGSTLTTEEQMQTLNLPSLIMQGDKDNLAPKRFARLFAESIPGAQMIVYEGVGHMVQEEVPQRSAQDMRDFLNSIYTLEPDTLHQALESDIAIPPTE